MGRPCDGSRDLQWRGGGVAREGGSSEMWGKSGAGPLILETHAKAVLIQTHGAEAGKWI